MATAEALNSAGNCRLGGRPSRRISGLHGSLSCKLARYLRVGTQVLLKGVKQCAKCARFTNKMPVQMTMHLSAAKPH